MGFVLCCTIVSETKALNPPTTVPMQGWIQYDKDSGKGCHEAL